MKIKNSVKLILIAALAVILSACTKTSSIPESHIELDGLSFEERAELKYADQFAIDRYSGDTSVIYTTAASYLILPENADVPNNIGGDMRIIRKPLHNIYLAGTADMDFFDSMNALDTIRFSAAKAEDWSIDGAKTAMEKGDIIYAGKYREPDYELLLVGDCPLAIESTMIEHTPEVKEKLEELGITVFVDYSSYEKHPLGRCEWIKVYGEMLGEHDEAERLFNEQAALMPENLAGTGKTVVYFYVNNNGQAVTRKPGDYVTKMIELAGGSNVFKKLGDDTKSSTVTLEMEDFYTTAKDADIIIYDTTISGAIASLDDLKSKNALLADFKAVKDNNVWSTNENMFQSVMKTGEIISEFNALLSGNTENKELKYIHKVRGDAVE